MLVELHHFYYLWGKDNAETFSLSCTVLVTDLPLWSSRDWKSFISWYSKGANALQFLQCFTVVALFFAMAVAVLMPSLDTDLSSLQTQGSFPDESAPSKCKRFLFGFWQKILFPLPNVIAMLSANLMLELLNNFTVKKNLIKFSLILFLLSSSLV